MLGVSSSISTRRLDGYAAGRDGTRPSRELRLAGSVEFHLDTGTGQIRRWSRWNSTFQRAATCPECRVPSRQGDWADTPLVEVELDLPEGCDLPGVSSSISTRGLGGYAAGGDGTRPGRARPPLDHGIVRSRDDASLHLLGVFHVVVPILRTLFQQFFFVLVHLVFLRFPVAGGEVT